MGFLMASFILVVLQGDTKPKPKPKASQTYPFLNRRNEKGEEMVPVRHPAGFLDFIRKIDEDLLEAVSQNNVSKAKAALAKGANPNLKEYQALIRLNGTHAQIMSMCDILLASGAEPNTSWFRENLISQTIMDEVARKKNPDPADLIHYFIDKGLNVNNSGWRGQSPLHYAAEKGYLNCLNLLMAAGANVNAKTVTSPADETDSNKESYSDSYEPGYLPIGVTPLMMSMPYKWRPMIVDALISAGANIHDRDAFGWTVLHHAVYSGEVEAVKFWIDKGIPVNSPSYRGYTPLHAALYDRPLYPNGDIVILLLKSGADKNLVNKAGETPFAMLDRRLKAEVRRIALDPNYDPYTNRTDEVLKNVNDVRKMLKPNAEQIKFPHPPTGAEGTTYLPLDYDFITVSRTVKRRINDTTMKAVFRISPTKKQAWAKVVIENVKLDRISSMNHARLSFTLKQGESKTVLYKFPKSAGSKGYVDCKYNVEMSDETSVWGGN